ncbi:hypothetical protein FTX61_00075 [Nitriliruptoraceae bacterium ZYF776]|nr:hypothetical protein [Profundirhabdus halotolerans]
MVTARPPHPRTHHVVPACAATDVPRGHDPPSAPPDVPRGPGRTGGRGRAPSQGPPTTPRCHVPRSPLTATGLDRWSGRIAAAGWSSGHQTVVGMWHATPLDRPVVDVMWVDPDGRRTLLAPSTAAATAIADLYAFDAVRVVAIRGGADADRVHVEAGPLTVDLQLAPRDWRSWLFATRPRALRRSPAWIAVEDRLVPWLAGPLLGGAPGVRLAGPTPGGRHEWYGIDDYRPVRTGALTVEGRPAGTLGPLRQGLGVGLSDFPTHPALCHVTTLIEAPGPDGG